MPEYHYINEQAFSVTDFLTRQECDASIALAESIGFSEAPINGAMGPVFRRDIRNNQRVILDDLQRAAEFWKRITDYIPQRINIWKASGINERFRFYRYDQGQQFDWHRDGYFERPDGERSQLTLLIYLNDDFIGGETTIEKLNITPKKGMALCFMHQVMHKGQAVEAGRKYALRTDVMYRRQSS